VGPRATRSGSGSSPASHIGLPLAILLTMAKSGVDTTGARLALAVGHRRGAFRDRPIFAAGIDFELRYRDPVSTALGALLLSLDVLFVALSDCCTADPPSLELDVPLQALQNSSMTEVELILLRD